jgi:hypothetical protein
MNFTVNSRVNKLIGSFIWASTMFFATLPVFGETCWKIEQHCAPIGDCTVYLSPVALRIDAHTTGSTIIAKAPLWQVNYFNKDSHRLAKCAFQTWHGPPSSRLVELWYDTKPTGNWTSKGLVNYRKFDCERYLSEPRTIDVQRVKEKLSPDEMWRSSDLKLAPEQGAILSKFYGFPRLANRNSKSVDQMPLFLMVRKEKNAPAQFLQTQSCEQVPPANIFELPKHFQPVAEDLKVEAGKADFFMPFNP